MCNASSQHSWTLPLSSFQWYVCPCGKVAVMRINLAASPFVPGSGGTCADVVRLLCALILPPRLIQSSPPHLCSISASPLLMPKAVVVWKVATISTPANTTIKVKTTSQAQTINGHATSTNSETTLNVFQPDPIPTPSELPALYPKDPVLSDESDEQENLVEVGAQKASRKAVSVSLHLSCMS